MVTSSTAIAKPGSDIWTSAQKRVAALVFFAVLIDGFDVQLMSLCLPAIARDLNLQRGAFAGVLAMGTIGSALGALSMGVVLDRIGRKWSLAISLLVIALASTSMLLCDSIGEFTVVRLFVGIGIGGAMTSATTCLAEFTPPHRRSSVIAFGVLCMPVGGLWASATCAFLLERAGWQSMFLIGGLLSLSIAAITTWRLPESPGFLALQPHRRQEHDRVVAWLGAQDWASDAGEEAPPGEATPLLKLVSREWWRDSLCVWAALFFSLLTAFMTINWLPSLMVQQGATISQSSSALGINGIGAILGSVACVVVLQPMGTRKPLWTIGLAGVAIYLVTAWGFQAKLPIAAIFVLFALSQFSGAFLQSLLYTLVARIYPASMRGSGVGIGMAIGRAGAIASAFVGGWGLTRGAVTFYLLQGASVALTVFFALLVKRHVPGSRPTISG